MRFLKMKAFIFISAFSVSLQLRSKFQKVTDSSRKESNIAQFVDKEIEETASSLGISKAEARERVGHLVKSKNGLDHNNHLLKPIPFCSRKKDEKRCSISQITPAKPAGFPTSGSMIPFPFTKPNPTCEAIVDTCFPTCPSCDKCGKFRSIDGRCNNLETSAPVWTGAPEAKPSPCPRNWGSVNQAFRRHVPNTYQDSVDVPTGGFVTTLPHPRTVSNAIHMPVTSPTDPTFTHMLMQLGQFLDHDISLTPEIDLEHSCCQTSNPECFPLSIPAGDPFYSESCKDFTRSAFKCKLDKTNPNSIRQQFNGITAYIDGSQIYGSDTELQSHLRTKSGGKLRVTPKGGEEYLPISRPCGAYSSSGGIGPQFKAGDIRVTENPGLQSLHTIFMREHNRIATIIAGLRYTWSNDRVYEEARRIVIAEWQNVVYGEFLPAILGPTGGIDHTTDSTYDNTEDATIFNVFATAAYRFGHSLITGTVSMDTSGSYELEDNFFKIDEIWNNNHLDGIVKGNTMQNTERSDKFIVHEVRNELFQNVDPTGTITPGTDLPARNIQRGRDHGIGSYKHYRDFCNIVTPIGSDIASWSDLLSVYGGVANKVEIFPAGLSETHVPGALVGPTFHCLLKKQFQSLKDGDRFFFTHKQNPCKCEFNCNRFSTAQQNLIMQRKLCNIIQDNTGVSGLQADVLKSGGGSTCSSSNLDAAAIETLLTDTCPTPPFWCNKLISNMQQASFQHGPIRNDGRLNFKG